MKKPGRRKIQVTSSDLDELNAFLDQLRFMTKQQERFNQISDKTEFSEDEQKLVKANLREMKAHKNRLETLEMIKFKSKTTQQLTDLEKEILSYDLSKRDDFFNCHKAINTYLRLEKITHSEIKRIDQKVRNERIQKVRKEQTEAQKQRTAENRHKYFLGASVLRLKQMLGFDDMNDLDFLKLITNSALLWSAANQEYNLKKPEYYERITSLITNKVDEVEDFIEQAKNDARK
ncbi:hypothetical protein RFI02_19885 [Acinetobacter sichuanensis]|uniref:hypothetical protein n=1 Tax=Acinetobacter sichuanensis TaxID=2136183 RepID=UPI00280E649D|nr:hypothetical protein [Acinetobacter sichuanensis]MDQ9023354.1 hypothetical protein [Acinetobacter sichuanensis]